MPGLNICVASAAPQWLSYFYVPVLVYEVILFGLALYVCWKHIEDLRKLGHWSWDSIVATLFKDSILYFTG